MYCGVLREMICPTGKSLVFLSIPLSKNISLPTPPKSVACAARLVPKEGRLAIVTDVGNGMRWTLVARLTNVPRRTAKSCGPDAPMLASSFAEESPLGEGGKQP